jgi:hypothetical protein
MIVVFVLLAAAVGSASRFLCLTEQKEIGFYCCNAGGREQQSSLELNSEQKRSSAADESCKTCCTFDNKRRTDAAKKARVKQQRSSKNDVGVGANNIAWLISSGVLFNAAQQLSLEIANEANAYPLPDASGQDGCFVVRRRLVTLAVELHLNVEFYRFDKLYV